ncbi:ABC transporter ATP-binding protein [Henriciella litoralis]|uniref:ABC transporter ATP-binding protein n=1 Tax=Henriciella litoralis TaxID=568102 RepID=UPI000A040239|nr:ABC transporter ATP-binding protein [Henriciella litoralis]
MIEVSDLKFQYAGQATLAVNGINLAIRKGSCLGLLGPNGAGKSTLIGLMTGVLSPDSGQIQLNGELVQHSRVLRQKSASAPQDLAFYPRLTVSENLAFFAGAEGLSGKVSAERRAWAIEACSLQECLDKRSERLSGGQKRRLNLAISLLGKPDILYLDEPTVGIDAVSRETIISAVAALQKSGTTIVYTSHYMEEIEALCDAVAIVDGGRLVLSGPMQELVRTDADRVILTAGSQLTDAQRQMAVDAGATLRDGIHIVAPVRSIGEVAPLVQALEAAGVEIVSVRAGEERLQDLYLRAIGAGEVAA